MKSTGSIRKYAPFQAHLLGVPATGFAQRIAYLALKAQMEIVVAAKLRSNLYVHSGNRRSPINADARSLPSVAHGMAHRWTIQQLCGGSVEPNAAFHPELTRGDRMQTTTLHTNRVTRLIFSVALSVITLFAVSKPGFATGNVVPADLAGNWQMTIIGETGCGFGTTLYTFTLNASGVATNVSGVSHSACGTGNFSGDSFTIQSLSANGSGTANFRPPDIAPFENVRFRCAQGAWASS
jgi:hypothetical protein